MISETGHESPPDRALFSRRWRVLGDSRGRLGAFSGGAAVVNGWTPRSGGLPRADVGPAFAHGRYDLGDLAVEGVKLLNFGSARDEGASIAGYARAPNPLNRACCRDVRQRVTGHEDQIRALPGR